MIREYAGNAKATALTGQLTATATAINILDGTGYPTGAVGPFVVTISAGLAAEEKVLCIARVGNTLTADPAGRGYDGTVANEHSNAATVQHTYSATDAREANAHVNDTTGDPHGQYLREDVAGTTYVARALADAKGDLVVATGPDAFARFPVGATTQVLTADSGEPTGMRWASSAVYKGARARTSANMAVPANTATSMLLDIEDYDVGDLLTPGATTMALTAGSWLVQATVVMVVDTASSTGYSVALAGSGFGNTLAQTSLNYTAFNSAVLQIDTVVRVATTATLGVAVTATAARTLQAAGSHLTVAYLGA